MRHLVFAILLIIVLPQAAAAAPPGARAEPVLKDGAPLERAAVPARELDPGIDGVPPAVPPDPADGASRAERAQRGAATAAARADRGLSFGFEIRPRSRFGALARKNDADDPSLGDQLDKLIERPVFGLRGRYRF